jgi:hypothetical protein
MTIVSLAAGFVSLILEVVFLPIGDFYAVKLFPANNQF